MTGDDAEKEQRSGRLGGARADFVASLGRKVADGFKATMTILFDDLLPTWNYVAKPQ